MYLKHLILINTHTHTKDKQQQKQRFSVQTDRIMQKDSKPIWKDPTGKDRKICAQYG